MDCNLDLEKVAEAIATMKTTEASTAIGCAVIDAAETASHMFRGSIGLDITGLVIERIEIAKGGSARLAPKRRGRKPKKETDNA